MAKKKTRKKSVPSVKAYAGLLNEIKDRVRNAQVKAALAANREMVQLYWDIGEIIIKKQEKEGWGKSVIEHLAEDIQKEFPGISGFSPANIWRMRAFYLAYTKDIQNLAQGARETEKSNLAQVVREIDGKTLPYITAEIPWGHNIILIEKIKDPIQRFWYAEQTIENGWSRNVLVTHIESGLYKRQGKAVTNFDTTLPAPRSDLARQTLKDPYVFDFLTLDTEAREQELEQGLLDHLQKFLIELGKGFAFVGRQVHIEVEKEDYYLDLLFYHLHLHYEKTYRCCPVENKNRRIASK